MNPRDQQGGGGGGSFARSGNVTYSIVGTGQMIHTTSSHQVFFTNNLQRVDFTKLCSPREKTTAQSVCQKIHLQFHKQNLGRNASYLIEKIPILRKLGYFIDLL
jgi:hypothetical protein